MNSQNVMNQETSAKQAETDVQPGAHKIDLVDLFNKHQHHLLRFVQRYVRNAEDAEDVVQNTFVEALRCINQFSGLSKPSTWLFGIALNLARNHVRRACADITETIDDDFINQIVDKNADPAMVIELREIANQVETLLNSLTPEIRMTFEAVLDREATYEEAAEQLQIPVGTVRSRVSRVRSAVRSLCS